MKRVFLLLLACCLLIAPAAAAGGSGTAADPYIIQTAAELQSVQNNLAAYYVLANDIDMSTISASWSPIGSESSPFYGSLDGRNYVIKNLNLNVNYRHAALFGAICSGAQIKNINFVDCSVSSSYNSASTRASILAGLITGTSTDTLITIDNIDFDSCTVYGAFDSVSLISGIVASNAKLQLSNCDVTDCSVTGASWVSVLGAQYYLPSDCTITNCNIDNSYVYGSGHSCGIIIGSFSSNDRGCTVLNCNVNNCVVSANRNQVSTDAGLLIGYIYRDSMGLISDCSVKYSSLHCEFNDCGGILGNDGSTQPIQIINCIVENCCLNSAGSLSGGICGASNGDLEISNCDVINTNVYAVANVNDIAPPGTYDSTSTATGITNVADRYLYASGLSATPNGATVSYTLEGQQGSTTVEATQGTAQSWAWTFGDGATSSVAEDTTHTYAAPGTYSTSLTLKNYLDSTGITVTTSDYNILPIPPTVSASANVLQLGQSTTLSAVGTLFSTIQWQYSTDSGATWQDISGATTATYEWTPTAGVYQVRAHVSAVGTGFTADSNVLTVSVYAPPTINAVTVSPTIGQYTQTITLSAEVTDSGPAPTTYQWQQSPEGQNTWTNIQGATTAQWIGQLTFAGATDFRLIATGTGGQTISETVTYYIALPGEIQSLTATPSVVTLPGSTTLTATGSNVISWEWQQYTSGVWTPIGYSASVTQRFTDAGTYQFRVLATGADGAVVTSETVEVIAGFAPSVSITSPNDGTRYQSGERIPLTATITGTDPTWEWSFGSQDVQTGGNSQTTWVEYGIDGRYTISIRVVSLFGTDEDSITIISGRESRPIATTPPIELESDGIFEATDSLTPNENGMPDITGFIMSMSKPFTDMIGAWFYFVLFAVPYLIIWIRQKNIIIPSILGVLFAAWVLIQLPAAALPAAIALITLSVTGGLYGIYVKLQNR